MPADNEVLTPNAVPNPVRARNTVAVDLAVATTEDEVLTPNAVPNPVRARNNMTVDVAATTTEDEFLTTPDGAGAPNGNQFATPTPNINQITAPSDPTFSGPQQQAGLLGRIASFVGIGSGVKAVQATPVAGIPPSPTDSTLMEDDSDTQRKKKGKRVTFVFRSPVVVRSPVRPWQSPVKIRSPVTTDTLKPEKRMTRSATKAKKAKEAAELLSEFEV